MVFAVLRTSAVRAARIPASRTFATSTVAKKDLIQDLYLNQLRSYKPPAKAADAHASVVKSYTAPQAPQPPSLPSDLAAELNKFDSAEPALESKQGAQQAASSSSSADETGGESAEEYLAFLEKDLPKAEAHH